MTQRIRQKSRPRMGVAVAAGAAVCLLASRGALREAFTVFAPTTSGGAFGPSSAPQAAAWQSSAPVVMPSAGLEVGATSFGMALAAACLCAAAASRAAVTTKRAKSSKAFALRVDGQISLPSLATPTRSFAIYDEIPTVQAIAQRQVSTLEPLVSLEEVTVQAVQPVAPAQEKIAEPVIEVQASGWAAPSLRRSVTPRQARIVGGSRRASPRSSSRVHLAAAGGTSASSRRSVGAKLQERPVYAKADQQVFDSSLCRLQIQRGLQHGSRIHSEHGREAKTAAISDASDMSTGWRVLASE